MNTTTPHSSLLELLGWGFATTAGLLQLCIIIALWIALTF